MLGKVASYPVDVSISLASGHISVKYNSHLLDLLLNNKMVSMSQLKEKINFIAIILMIKTAAIQTTVLLNSFKMLHKICFTYCK